MTQRNTDDDLLLADRKMAAVKALIEEADDLFVFLCEIEGGDAEVERTAARAEVFHWVMALPKFSRAARKRLFEETG
ncbi:hypothetical protein [Bradyrhizobium sp. Ash2021]|uniref:hypothetical protein n=1 Tax=Bradyrhizobium sp. Ash2021 TaxID=2954771 RepID=UPI0028152D14|nr:hypothetical protein [Bradyrhizobium sp. Ash2021]WMT75077.1 hypothetical protein NL528_01135 [Bradyrhizobium sp. Ash2021]